MQARTVKFSSFVKTKMYLYVFLYLELWCKLCSNFDPTQATRYKNHPAKGTKRKETSQLKEQKGKGGETKAGLAKRRQCFK